MGVPLVDEFAIVGGLLQLRSVAAIVALGVAFVEIMSRSARRWAIAALVLMAGSSAFFQVKAENVYVPVPMSAQVAAAVLLATWIAAAVCLSVGGAIVWRNRQTTKQGPLAGPGQYNG